MPTACQDRAATKAAYRFFSNPRVDEGIILAGHLAATKARFATTAGPILVLHDTTEFSLHRDNPGASTGSRSATNTGESRRPSSTCPPAG